MDLHPLWDWFRVHNETTGIKLTIFYDAFDRARFFNGFLSSVRLMAVCLGASVGSVVVGVWIQGSRLRVLRLVAQGYIEFFRNTPPLVQLYFFYFALGSYLKITSGNGIAVPIVSNFTWAAICLSFYAGAFNVEIFRAGIEAVPRETLEAAESLGYSRLKAYAYVILPLAFRISLPALNNNLRSEEHTSELQSQSNLVCRLLLEKKKKQQISTEGAQPCYFVNWPLYFCCSRRSCQPRRSRVSHRAIHVPAMRTITEVMLRMAVRV